MGSFDLADCLVGVDLAEYGAVLSVVQTGWLFADSLFDMGNFCRIPEYRYCAAQLKNAMHPKGLHSIYFYRIIDYSRCSEPNRPRF